MSIAAAELKLPLVVLAHPQVLPNIDQFKKVRLLHRCRTLPCVRLIAAAFFCTVRVCDDHCDWQRLPSSTCSRGTHMFCE
jgi:hypothetical protein